MNVRQRPVPPSSPGRYMTNVSEIESPQKVKVVKLKSTIKTKKEYALSDEETIPLNK